MTELDERQVLAHELISLETIIIPCRNLLSKNTDDASKHVCEILERAQKRAELCRPQLNAITSHEHRCYKNGCPNREKFPPKSADDRDDGSWPA